MSNLIYTLKHTGSLAADFIKYINDLPFISPGFL